MVIGGMRLGPRRRDRRLRRLAGRARRRARDRGQPGDDRRAAVLGHPVVSDHAADPPAWRPRTRSCASRAPRTPSRRRWPSAAASRASCTTCSRTRCPRCRCSSRARGCWPATAAPTPRSSTAWSARTSSRRRGLTEARQAIAALRGDDLPAAGAISPTTFPGATLTVTGEPREPSSEARLALYRTAQEALTNVRRHSASERVELRLDYARRRHHADGAGPRRRRAGDQRSHGYGLTGMRERAELLGGRLNAGPTDDGFRVELWLPR